MTIPTTGAERPSARVIVASGAGAPSVPSSPSSSAAGSSTATSSPPVGARPAVSRTAVSKSPEAKSTGRTQACPPPWSTAVPPRSNPIGATVEPAGSSAARSTVAGSRRWEPRAVSALSQTACFGLIAENRVTATCASADPIWARASRSGSQRVL